MHDTTALMREDHEAPQQPERRGGHDEEVARCDLVDVVIEKRAPGLRRWPSRFSPAALLSPVKPEAEPVPSYDRFGLDDDERLAPASPQTREQHPEDSITIVDDGPCDAPVINSELLSEREILEGEPRPIHQQGPPQDKERPHHRGDNLIR